MSSWEGETILHVAFLSSVVMIWFLIAYQLVLSVAGFFHVLASEREARACEGRELAWPRVAILVPARNEARVIDDTLDALLGLDYPKEKLEVVVINDASTDDTGELVRRRAARDGRVRLIDVPAGEGGKGKSRVLNRAWATTSAPILAIYDADNTPKPQALRQLVAQLLLHPGLSAVIGKFRTVNRRRNLLTRFINVETLAFQSIVQAGRYRLFGKASLPGTNYVIRREVVAAIGGWDEQAITEDLEMSVRMWLAGYRIKMIPYAVTEEQEPESWAVWARQRTRWVRGHNYVAFKFLRQLRQLDRPLLALEILYPLLLYYVFFGALVVSHAVFLLGLAGGGGVSVPGPYLAVWVLGGILFVLEILLALSYDGEDTWAALGVTVLAYFTYCQAWLWIVARAQYLELVERGQRPVWIKTERFARTDLGA